MRINRWIVTHLRALLRYPDEPDSYQSRLAFEKGAWDGHQWLRKKDLDFEGCGLDVPPEHWEHWRTGFSATSGH